MVVEFEFNGMNFQAVVIVTSPSVPPRMTGHPDTWREGEPAEIEITELRCAEKTAGPLVRLHNAMFLLDSTLAEEIETSAIQAVEKHAKADHADALINTAE